MGKRKRTPTKERISAWIKSGRGQGRLQEYKPWLTIQDVASKGLATRLKGITTGRMHHFLSLIELRCFYPLDWSTKVVDIREQFPLLGFSNCPAETSMIAKELGVAHPAPHNREPIVMTTDFLVSVKDADGIRDIAISVKSSKDLLNRRTLQKLEIERVYWQRRRIKWAIFTERDVNAVLVKNIEWVHSCSYFLSFDPANERRQIDAAEEFMFSRLYAKHRLLGSVTAECDSAFGFPAGTSMRAVRYLIGTKRWAVDMSIPIEANRRLAFIGSI